MRTNVKMMIDSTVMCVFYFSLLQLQIERVCVCKIATLRLTFDTLHGYTLSISTKQLGLIDPWK